MGRSRCISALFRRIDFLGEFRCLPVHMEQLHRSGKHHNAGTGSLIGKPI